jgi:sec-independent protein translocase protein TatA
MGYTRLKTRGNSPPRCHPTKEGDAMIPVISVPLFGIGLTEALLIGAAVILLFGASKLPKLGRGLGEGLRNFKRGITGELDEGKNAPKEIEGAAQKNGVEKDS